MTSVGAALTVLFCIAVLLLPKRQAVLAYVGAVLYITQGQAIDVGGINMMAIRFVEVAAAIRVLARGEINFLKLTSPDYCLLLSFFVYMMAIFIRTGFIDWYTIGLAVDGILAFFSLRALISTPEDFGNFIKGMVFLLTPFALFMVEEAIRGRNLFSLMGGVPEIPVFREGYFRCQASFRHAITAGTVGATFLPIFIGFFFFKGFRVWALIGIVDCLTIVITSHSSGPLMGIIVAFAAWCCWGLRRQMKWVNVGILTALIGLHLMMKAPVWFIFDRISGVIGGDGWHRARIIDKFVNSFGDWWLVGMPMEKTINWAATVTKFGFADITNYYVSIGINGGLISLIVFVALLVQCFRLVGQGLTCIRKNHESAGMFEPILWGAGCAVCVHAINLTAVSYWDQSYVIWYLHLAVSVTLGKYFLESTAAETVLGVEDSPKNLRRFTPVRLKSSFLKLGRRKQTSRSENFKRLGAR